MLNRTISVSNPGRPEFAGTDDDGNPIVQFVYDIDIQAATATILPRGSVWQWFPPGPASYSWGVNPRQITELGFEWFMTRPGPLGLAPGFDDYPEDRFSNRLSVWNPDTQSFIDAAWWDFQPRDADAPAPAWEAAAQPLPVSTTTGDGTGRIVLNADQLPLNRYVDIVVRSRFAIDKPKRHNDKIGFSNMLIVGRINETVGPVVSLSSPFAPNLTSPISIAGYAADLSLHGSQVSGISAVDYSVTDIGSTPPRMFDSDTNKWSESGGKSTTIEALTPVVGTPGVLFDEQWRNPDPTGSSNEFRLEVRALDGSGNVTTLQHQFTLDDADPVVRFEAPRDRQVVTGDIIAVDGTVADGSPISTVRMSVASNTQRRYLDRNTAQWVDAEVSFEPILSTAGGVTSFHWAWPAPDDTDFFTVYVTAQDATGQETRSRLSFGWAPADTQPPLAVVMSPRENTTHSGTMQVRGRAYDNIELAEIRVEVWSHMDAMSGPLTRVFDEPMTITGATAWKYFSVDVDVDAITANQGPGLYSVAVMALDVTGYEVRDLHEVTFEL